MSRLTTMMKNDTPRGSMMPKTPCGLAFITSLATQGQPHTIQAAAGVQIATAELIK